MHLFHLFCYYFSNTCAHTRLSQTTIILFIQSSTTIFNVTIPRWLLRVNNVHDNEPLPSLDHLRVFTCNNMTYFYLDNLVRGKKMTERQNILLHPWRLTIRSLCGKVINNRNYLSLFYYCRLFPNIRNSILIIPFGDLKTFFLSRLNSWHNLLDSLSKTKMMINIKVDRNKVVCPDFVRNVLDGCRDNHYDLSLVDMSTNLLLLNIQDLPCLILVLVFL